MSGRLLALVLSLAVTSAAVGAGAAWLLRTADEPQPGNDVSTVETTQSAAAVPQQAQQTPVEEATQVQAQSGSAARPQPANQGNQVDLADQVDQAAQAGQEEAAQPSEPAQTQATPAEIEEPPQREEPDQPTDDVTQESEQPASTEPEQVEVATVSPEVIVQGGALSVTLAGFEAHAAAATVAGRSWDLSSEAAGEWWGIIAVPRDAEPGVTDVLVDLYGEGGVWLRTIAQSIMILANTAPFEEVVLGGTGTPADPAAVAYDIAVRFTEHTAVSGPPRWQGAWILPVEGEVTGVFGAQRSYDGVVAPGWHHGHDIAAQQGDPIVAPAHGTVVWTGELVLHGMGVIVDHGAGVYSGYWHMSLIAVRAGHEVAPGDWLGNIGTTGLSTGPHLHWEVIIQGVDVDPVQWLGDDRPPLAPGVEVRVEVSESSEDTLQ